MKKLFTIVCLIFITLDAHSQRAKIDENTVVIDSTNGYEYPYSVWMSLLKTGKYYLKSYRKGKSDTLYLTEMSEKMQKRRFSGVIPPSKFFTTNQKIASFSTSDIEGNSWKLKKLKGKVVVLNFWFIACGPCRMEIPELNNLTEKFKDSSDVVFLAIALDDSYDIKDFIKTHPFKYKIIDDKYISKQYNINTFPTNVIIDKQGQVIYHTSGYYGEPLIEEMGKKIEEALKN